MTTRHACSRNYTKYIQGQRYHLLQEAVTSTKLQHISDKRKTIRKKSAMQERYKPTEIE